MSPRPMPTDSPEALLSYVRGRESLRAYLTKGLAADLEQAKQSFAEAEQSDPSFALASFYLAVADSELRHSDAAISRLNNLAQRSVEILPETYLQLAYAHTKKYEDAHYFEAEHALDRAREQAKVKDRRDLVPVIEAYRTFLFSVMGGRLQQGDRALYLRKAIELGNQLLADRSIAKLAERDQVLFEIHNALGISYMRKGQQDPTFSAQQEHAWALAERHYREALNLRPHAARVMENMGTLRKVQGDQLWRNGDLEQARNRYREAQIHYRQSLELNPRDQFPHYRMAELSAKLGIWEEARRFYDSGRREQGAVKEHRWERLNRAIQEKDNTELWESEG